MKHEPEKKMEEPMLSRIALENFTAFRELELELSPGVNVFIGANGTGKTHLLKLLYCACAITNPDNNRLDKKLEEVFLPYERNLGRLVRAGIPGNSGRVFVVSENCSLISTVKVLSSSESRVFTEPDDVTSWADRSIPSVFIPAKEFLENAPGFRSLYKKREIHFDETYLDILDLAYLDPLREEFLDDNSKRLLALIEESIGGSVTRKDEHFFIKHPDREIEFMLEAEGFRKLALLWLLVRNGSIAPGTVLLWDEPESNLNPALMKVVIQIILELQRSGVQVFLATHSYFVLKELDLQSGPADKVRYHSLYRDSDSGEILSACTDDYDVIDPNLILDTLGDLYDRDLDRGLGEASDGDA